MHLRVCVHVVDGVYGLLITIKIKNKQTPDSEKVGNRRDHPDEAVHTCLWQLVRMAVPYSPAFLTDDAASIFIMRGFQWRNADSRPVSRSKGTPKAKIVIGTKRRRRSYSLVWRQHHSLLVRKTNMWKRSKSWRLCYTVSYFRSVRNRIRLEISLENN